MKIFPVCRADGLTVGNFPAHSESMVNIDQFLELVDLYASKMKLAESTVSTRIFNDGKRLRMLRDGNDVGIRKVEDAVKYLSDNWPDGVAWPKRITRPVKVDQ